MDVEVWMWRYGCGSCIGGCVGDGCGCIGGCGVVSMRVPNFSLNRDCTCDG